MKKYLLSVTALLVALSAQAAVYTGATAAYTFGDEEMMYLARVGTSFGEAAQLTHHVELEVGFYEIDVGYYDIELDLIPVMANYRLSFAVAEPLSLYVGAGIGATKYKESGRIYGRSVSYSDTLLTMQTLIGAEYAFNQSFSALLGLRYMWWHNLEDYDDEGIDDVAVEAGFVVKF